MKLLYFVILLILSVSVSASASKQFTPPSSSSDDENYDKKEENDDDDDADEDEDEDEEDKVKEDNLPVKIPAQEETIAYDDPQYSEAEEAQDEAGRPLGELAGQPALQCYQCSLEDGKACSGSKEVLLANAAKFLRGCPSLLKNNGSSVMVVAAVGCWKLSQKVDYSQGPGLSAHYRVIRRCAYLGQEEASCASRTGYGTSTTQCFCSASRCNGAPAVSFGGGNGGLMVMVITVALGSSLLLHLLST